MTAPPPVVARPRSARARWLLPVWAAAAWPVVLWAVHGADPELAVRCAQLAAAVAGQGAIALGALAAVALLAFPPFPAWLRLCGSRFLLLFASDRGPLLRALADLRNFESGARHLEAGRGFLQRGELPAAAQHLTRAIELEPGLAAAHHLLGLVLLRAAQVPHAARAFLQAEQLEPGHAFGDALLHAGRAAWLAGDHAGGLRLLRAHRDRCGGSRRSHYWLADAELAAGETAAARAAFEYAAAPDKQRLTAEENWFRALARVRLWRLGRRS